MYCNNCGKEIKDGAAFCPYCGAKTSVGESSRQAGGGNGRHIGAAGGQAQPHMRREEPGQEYYDDYDEEPERDRKHTAGSRQPRQNPDDGRNVTYVYQQTPQWDPNNVPPEYKPISMWGYFGYELLFGIPIVGFILLIVMCFAPNNKNVKNFARSYFCYFIIVLIIVLIVTLGFGVSLTGIFDNL